MTVIVAFINGSHTAAPAIDVSQYMGSGKILKWKQGSPERVKQIERYIQLFHHDLSPGNNNTKPPKNKKVIKNLVSFSLFTFVQKIR